MKNLQTMKQSVQKGFTLIELMIVVAIIGILAALAIPAYQDYTIKSRVGEGASLTGAFKTAIEVYWSENGTLNGINVSGGTLGGAVLGLSSVEGEYVSAITVEAGPSLMVELKDTTKLGADAPTGANAGCFVYTPVRPDADGGNLKWSVSRATTACTTGVASKYLPRT